MVSKHVLLVVMFVFVTVVWLTSCNLLSPETRAEVLTQQNCLRGCIERCPPRWNATGNVQQTAATSANKRDRKAGRACSRGHAAACSRLAL